LTKLSLFLSELKKEIEVNPKKIRDFGWVMFIVLGLIIPLFIGYKNDWTITTAMQILFGTGLALLIPSLVAPKAMYGIYRGWMLFAIILGLFMTKVIISIVFLFIMTPIGLFRRVFVKDPLKMKFDPSAKTYWVDKNNSNAPESYEKQY